jgi:signal peptidase
MQSKGRSIASILTSILILSATAVALLSSIGAVSIGGYRPIVITSGSMQPSISRGDLLLIKKSDDITVGDIITFRPLTGQIDSVTHRVVGIENGLDGISYLTKGDANTTTDVVPIPDERVIGVVVREIPKVGFIALALHNRVFVVLLVLALVLMELTVWMSRNHHLEEIQLTPEGKQHENAI